MTTARQINTAIMNVTRRYVLQKLELAMYYQYYILYKSYIYFKYANMHACIYVYTWWMRRDSIGVIFSDYDGRPIRYTDGVKEPEEPKYFEFLRLDKLSINEIMY